MVSYMASSAVIPALPTSFGGTLIQANQLTLPAGTEYEQISYEAAKEALALLGGQDLFLEFPFGSKSEPVNTTFYSRKDIVSAAAPSSTIALVRRRTTVGNRAPNSTTTNNSKTTVTKVDVLVKMWHIMEVTLTDGTKFVDGLLSVAGFTAIRDPETAAILIPTSGYLALLEACDFILKPVAAGAPTYDPFYAAVLGRNPNV
jgi:hypothetical protein